MKKLPVPSGGRSSTASRTGFERPAEVAAFSVSLCAEPASAAGTGGKQCISRLTGMYIAINRRLRQKEGTAGDPMSYTRLLLVLTPEIEHVLDGLSIGLRVLLLFSSLYMSISAAKRSESS